MADEKAQIELDLENEVEVEIPEQESEQDNAPVEVAQDEDNFEKAENATQKRIDRLTKKMREAERQREEALKYAQSVQAEAHGHVRYQLCAGVQHPRRKPDGLCRGGACSGHGGW